MEPCKESYFKPYPQPYKHYKANSGTPLCIKDYDKIKLHNFNISPNKSYL